MQRMQQPVDTAKHDRFLRLVAEHQAALHNFIRSMLPNRAEASEVLQDVMVVLWQKFDAAEDFKKWAFGVARLETLKFLQSRARDRHVFDDALAIRLADDMVSLEQRHLSQREALESCLKKLGDTQRKLTLEAYTKGVHMNELAEQHGKTPMARYKLLHRIRQTLMDCVRRQITMEETA
jgi:RNA polymerase sigma-70 factor, ECF subfamily